MFELSESSLLFIVHFLCLYSDRPVVPVMKRTAGQLCEFFSKGGWRILKSQNTFQRGLPFAVLFHAKGGPLFALIFSAVRTYPIFSRRMTANPYFNSLKSVCESYSGSGYAPAPAPSIHVSVTAMSSIEHAHALDRVSSRYEARSACYVLHEVFRRWLQYKGRRRSLLQEQRRTALRRS